MERFSGFADASGKFWRALTKHNEKSWFDAHKAEFEEGWNAPMKLLLGEVHAGIDKAYEHCDLEAAKVFRIYRDVRFSKDKSPYKTHLGGHIAVKLAGRRGIDMPMALYFHVGDQETFGASGYYVMDTEPLERFRRAVADETKGRELVKILASLEKKGFLADDHERYKKVPKGYDESHPRAELLKRKGLMVRLPPLPAEMLTSPKLASWLIDGCKKTSPLVEWLAFATA